MDFIRNFPFFSIMFAMFSGVICSVLRGKVAKYLSMTVSLIITALSAVTLWYTLTTGTSFVFWMGHFPAPWGNEIRAGATEALTATIFSFIVFAILLGGTKYTEAAIEECKQHYFYILTGLLLGALLSLVYTNDMFTAYVFLEINTIAACGFIMIRHNGKAVASAIQYMTMSLLGSGLVLIGITLLYTVTGHLLMEPIHDSIVELVSEGKYTIPLIVIIGLITVGLAIKSGLYPFHLWIPDAYSHSLPTSSAMMSSLASKGYIFLLIKIYYRVIGLDSIVSSRVLNIVFVFGIIAIIMGSVHALNQGDIRKMSAFCSVSHIGYIFMCIGMGTNVGMCAALLHLYTHALTKPSIFLAIAGLSDVSPKTPEALAVEPERMPSEQAEDEDETAPELEKIDVMDRDFIRYPDLHISKPSTNSNRFDDFRGAGLRNRIAGLVFMLGAFSMIGVPFFAGFASKIYIGVAAFSSESALETWITMLALAVSTILMVGYFMRMVIQLYQPNSNTELPVKKIGAQKRYSVAMLLFVAANIFVGLCSGYIIDILEKGIKLFG